MAGAIVPELSSTLAGVIRKIKIIVNTIAFNLKERLLDKKYEIQPADNRYVNQKII